MSLGGGERPGEAWRRRLRERLLERLQDDERLVAEGRMRGFGYIMVTDRRLLWMERERVLSLPFDGVVVAQEIFEETHRFRLRLHHEPIDRQWGPVLPWDFPQHIRRLRQRKTWNRTTELRFSRANAAAAVAIRRMLTGAETHFLPPIVRPHRREEHVAILRPPRPFGAWWHRRRHSGVQ